MWTGVEKKAYQFLAAYRFLSYALSVMFTQVGPQLGTLAISDIEINIILAALGVYSLLRVFSRLRWREGSPMTYVILIGDFLISIVLVIYTGGLNSSFLLYSLTPIITAALFFEERTALFLAAGASVFLSITHLALSQVDYRFAWLMQGYNLTLLIVYSLFCFVTATVPYRTNLNIRRLIEREAIIEERRRIAREIHDGVAQALGFLTLKTKLASDSLSAHNSEKALFELKEMTRVVEDTYDDIREAIDQLSAEPRSLPLIPALTDYVRKFVAENKIKVKLDVPRNFPRLSPVAELQLLRVAQEALTNVRRHALASEVDVKLENTARMVEMTIKDNGCGFDLTGDYPQGEDEKSPSYHGLKIIKERAEGLGGKLVLNTAEGKGTEVKVQLPIEKVRL